MVGHSSFCLAIIWPPTLLMTTVNFGGFFGTAFILLCDPALPEPTLLLITNDGYERDGMDNVLDLVPSILSCSVLTLTCFSFFFVIPSVFLRWRGFGLPPVPVFLFNDLEALGVDLVSSTSCFISFLVSVLSLWVSVVSPSYDGKLVLQVYPYLKASS